MKRLAGILIIVIVSVATPAHAEMSPVVLSHVQAGVTGGATQELIAIHNNSAELVEVTGWCLTNKSSQPFFCFDEAGYHIDLEPWTSVVVVSQTYFEAHPDIEGDVLVYQPASQSSGSLVGSSDVVGLVDVDGVERDSYRWTSAWPSGMVAQRLPEEGSPTRYRQGTGEDWTTAPLLSVPVSAPVYRQAEGPIPCQVDCDPGVTEAAFLRITEILPNASGSDAGKEYIELFNSADYDIDIGGYLIGIHGATAVKTVAVPENTVIPAQSYRAIYNSDVGFTLGNTLGHVSLSSPSGELIAETAVYEKPADDMAWALIADKWQYTNQPTPGAENRESIVTQKTASTKVSTPKPCGENQYRHPDTNRCRNNVVATQPTPCKEGYYRHPETNRCRKIAVAATPTPCKPGQERNPETGRCRTVKQMTTLAPHTLGVTTEDRPQQWYVVWVIVGLMAALIGYGVWEWRADIRKFLGRAKAFLVKSR